MKRLVLAAAFVATVYLANWTLETYGIWDLPVLGHTPSGVLWAGLAFGIRDALRERARDNWRAWVLGAIAVGTALSYWLGDAITVPGGRVSIAAASGIAFGLSELADALVYERFRRSTWWLAVVASNVVAAIADSVLFVWLAFGDPFDALAGNVIGKWLMILPALPLVWRVRRR